MDSLCVFGMLKIGNAYVWNPGADRSSRAVPGAHPQNLHTRRIQVGVLNDWTNLFRFLRDGGKRQLPIEDTTETLYFLVSTEYGALKKDLEEELKKWEVGVYARSLKI